ncbi:MAG: glycosyltransferase family 39 protein [Microgenomates group bacterium]|nr:glycosyltransferase family 39 protein [Microgenomates group bacterium]
MIYWLFNNTPLLFFIQSFWRDEAFSFLLAKKRVVEIIFLTAKDFNPPLYYLILHFWIKIFGPGEIAVRALSLIFFIASFYIFFLFLQKILLVKKGWIFLYSILFLINPLLIYYAFEGRMYSLLLFFASLSFYCLLRKNSFGYFWSILLGLFTHYFMILVVGGQFLYIVLSTKKNYKIFREKIIKAGLIFFTWVIFLILNKNNIGKTFWIKKPKITDFFSLPFTLYTGYDFDFNFYQNSFHWLFAFWLILICVSIIYWVLKGGQNKLFFLIFVWAILIPWLVFLLSFLKPIFLSRYLIFSTFGLLILLVYILEKTPPKIRLFILVVLIFLTYHYNLVQIKYRRKADIRKVIREIKKLANENDFLFVTNELDFHTAEYYFGEKNVFIYGKTFEEIPDYVGKILIPKNKIVYSLPIYPQKAFVLKDDLTYSIQALY